MKKLNLKLAALGFLCAATFSWPLAASAAQGGNWGYQSQPNFQQLTPEQQAQASQIFNESYISLQNTREELAYKRSLLDQQLASPNPDSATIEKLSREIGELRGRMLAGRVAVRSQLEQKGLPPDCFGPCGGRGYEMMNNGWDRSFHHGERGHRNYGWGARHWRCW